MSAKASIRARGRLFGMEVDLISLEGATEAAMGLIGGAGGYIVTLNPEMCMRSLSDEAFLKAVREAAIVVPDGIGSVWALRRLGYRAAEKVAGIELAESLVAAAASRDIPVYLIGARPGVADRAASNLVLKHKGLRVVGVKDGYYDLADEGKVASAIAASGAGLVLVAMGAGRQELFMQKASKLAPSQVMIGIGGSFDVFAGDVARAPRIVRALNMEWLYRGLSDRARLRRLMKLPGFAATVLFKPGLSRQGRRA